jgi:excisionase family DNA binding protein
MDEFMSLHRLALRLGLPKTYIRRLADAGEIPFVRVGGRARRFCQADVADAIRQLAAKNHGDRRGSHD